MRNVRKSEKIKWPKVTLFFSALNDAQRMERCLKSIRKQDYPKKLLDLVVVDDGSSDNTVQISRKYGARTYINPGGYIYKNWMIAVRKSKGEFFFPCETDHVLGGADFIKKMVLPMLKDDRIVASFTDERLAKDMHWTARFLCYATAQADPLLEFLFDKIENKIVEKHKGYSLCKFDEKLQPAVRMFFRKRYFKKTLNWKSDDYFDHDYVINCVRAGYPYFAYVPFPGYFHYHSTSLKHLVTKRVRNIQKHFLPYYKNTEYVILDTGNKSQVFKLVLFVLYANTIILPTLRGIFRAIKFKDLVLLTEPIITISITDALLFAFIKDKQGRKFILDSLKTLVPSFKKTSN